MPRTGVTFCLAPRGSAARPSTFPFPQSSLLAEATHHTVHQQQCLTMSEEPRKRSRFDQTEPVAPRRSRFDQRERDRSRSPRRSTDPDNHRQRTRSPQTSATASPAVPSDAAEKLAEAKRRIDAIVEAKRRAAQPVDAPSSRSVSDDLPQDNQTC
jgi:hypothetical protein